MATMSGAFPDRAGACRRWAGILMQVSSTLRCVEFFVLPAIISNRRIFEGRIRRVVKPEGLP